MINSNTKREILILGAGPAGLSCALALARAGKKSLIIEKDEAVGGLAKTLVIREGELIFRTDIGPHRFFSKSKYLYDLIKELLGPDWILIRRKTRQLIEGKFYDYPVNAWQAFRNIGLFRSVGMGLSYLWGAARYRLFKKEMKSFEDYIVATFGKKLGDFNMLNYTEKIWGLPTSQLHPDWAKQRIRGLNLRSALAAALIKKKNRTTPKTLIDSFYYPRYGTGQIYCRMAEEAVKAGSCIVNNSYPVKIEHRDDRITEVVIRSGDLERTIAPSVVFSSIPMNEFVTSLDPAAPAQVDEAVRNLSWRAQVYLFLTLNKTRVTDDNWIYFPDRGVPIGRIAEMKNFSPDMSPADKTSLMIEFFVMENDEIWSLDNEKILQLAIQHLSRYCLVSASEVRNYYVYRRRNVYPVYDLNYRQNVKTVKDFLNRFKNLYYIGRPGRFQYTNQDHSIEMGLLAAKSLIDGQRYDLDKIGTEDEYFEKGFVKSEV